MAECPKEYRVVESKCPLCGRDVRFEPWTAISPYRWLACCDANAYCENGKLLYAGNRAHDWVGGRGRDWHVDTGLIY